MAVNPVSLAETLRPWYGAGLTSLLRDSSWAERPDLPQADTGPDASHISISTDLQLHTPRPSRDLDRSSRQSEAVPEAGYSSEPMVSQNTPQDAALPGGVNYGFSPSLTEKSLPVQYTASAFQDAEASMKSKPPLVPSEPTISQKKATGQHSSPVLSEMPEEWRRLLARTQAAPLLWTYAELGSDLSSQSNDEGSRMRSQTLRNLIGSLNLPKGSSCFWPITLRTDWAEILGQGQQASDTCFFRFGLTQIAPKSVVLFGHHSVALSGLVLALRLPFTQQIVQGKLIVLLPSFADLQHSEPAQTKAAAYLRSAFSSFTTLFIR